RQIIFYVSGFFMVFVLTFIPVKWMKQYVWIIYGAGVLSLMILFFAPVSPVTPIINGAKRWYQFSSFSLPASQVVKIIYILTLAYVISQHNRYKLTNDLTDDVELLSKMYIITVLPMLLILVQKDLGTPLVMLVILLGMIIATGIIK